ncbi:uncharacterized protein BX663DRAFT_555094 [Cokeromyces recurvatus]|uniref:uncharacterized protein n=1 Tax=Cokeromyces recurvatus TaxID=90255 RepID=UPI00221EC7EF|nr:uncharacterized protein BX663DRAFT_555094 [Cokeromyces recurvatus]KAI7899226.1 hypothetical protein BX663DRAFT_555094 [Cokeromyces recurvatus]
MKYTITSMLIVFALSFLIQSAESYCIYNYFDDDTYIDIYQENTYLPVGRAFSKSIGPLGSECCHYSVRDCSIRPIDYDYVYFHLQFHYPTHDSPARRARCYSGGALIFHGDQDHRSATCKHPNGTMYEIQLKSVPMK